MGTRTIENAKTRSLELRIRVRNKEKQRERANKKKNKKNGFDSASFVRISASP